jgi:hypothetical protein
VTCKGSATGLTASFFVVLTLTFSPSPGADAQTRGGGPVEAPKGSSDKEISKSLARQRARDLAEGRRYKGTEVKPDAKATGDALALQTRIANLFNADDLVPESRKKHFRWMSESEHTPITGWYGAILNVTPDSGSVVVTVRFGPRPVGGFATLSCTTERYRFADGKLRFLDLVYKDGVSTWN